MMTFLHPEFIYLMLPLLLILFGMLLTQSEIKEQFFSQEILQRLQVDSDQLSAKARNVLYFLMFLSLIFALAQPVIEEGTASVTPKNSTLYLAFDLNTPHLQERVEAVKRGLDLLGEVNVGLIAFDSDVYLLAAPTKDQDYLQTRLSELSHSEKQSDLSKFLSALDQLLDTKMQRVLLFDSSRYAAEVDGMSDTVELVASGRPIEVLFAKYKLKRSDVIKPIYFQLFVIPTGFAMLMFVLASSSFYRGEKYYLPVLLSSLCFGLSMPAEASLLDFRALEKAEQHYQNREYVQSSKLYKQYGLEHESKEAIYNAANSYYRQGAYAKAAELYRSIRFVSNRKNHDLFFNLGNTLVKIGTQRSLRAAEDAYLKALSFKEDRETRENLHKVQQYLKYLGGTNDHVTNRSKVYVQTSLLSKHSIPGERQVSQQELHKEKILEAVRENNRGHWHRIVLQP